MITEEKGANIIVNRWLEIAHEEKLLIVTDENQHKAALLMEKYAMQKGAIVDVVVIPIDSVNPGDIFEEQWLVKKFLDNDIIVGGTTYSLITTNSANRAIKEGKKFLSLPLSTKNGDSMLKYDFIEMNPDEAKKMALPIIEAMNKTDTIRVTTDLGTDITFRKVGRNASFFNGASVRELGVDSASFEVYLAVEETETNGVAYGDGSFGYIGKMNSPVKLEYKDGRLINIENTEDGKILKEYMKSFNDKDMYIAAELGIGLNSISRCEGRCYIEDESTYGTFHIGMGRNVSLGGKSLAKGHFDIVFNSPTIYAGDKIIMEKGKFLGNIN